MKRTCLQKNTIEDRKLNTDGQNTCEFHPAEILSEERHFDPKEIQSVRGFVRMKTLPLFALLVFISTSSIAQCYEYQTEIQTIENELEGVSKTLKKVEKATTFVDAQKIIDKAIAQAKKATEAVTMAKSIAQECNCDEGLKLAESIFITASDAYSFAQKAIDAGNIEKAKEFSKKAITAADNAKNEASYGSAVCNN